MKRLDEQAMVSELANSAFFKLSNRAPSQPVSRPTSLPAGDPAENPVRRPLNQPAEQSGAGPARRTDDRTTIEPIDSAVALQAVRPPDRKVARLEQHAYDIYADQARWIDRMQLELTESLGRKVNRYDIVQVAIDLLRSDYESDPSRSDLVKILASKP